MKKLNSLYKYPHGMWIILHLLVIFSICLAPAPTAAQENIEITIRNVTKETVHYTFSEARTYGESGERSLARGEIHRYSGGVALDITFMRGDEKVEYRIRPGSANSFRYDENGELELFLGAHGRSDVADLAPYVATPMSVVNKMLEMAKLDKDDILIDIGSGDGRIVITGAKKYGVHAVGIELDPKLIRKSKVDAKSAGVNALVSFRMEDATKANLSEATVVTMYLLTESNEMMRPHLERQLTIGTPVLTHNYPIERWENKLVDYVSFKAEDGKEHSIYLYMR